MNSFAVGCCNHQQLRRPKSLMNCQIFSVEFEVHALFELLVLLNDGLITVLESPPIMIVQSEKLERDEGMEECRVVNVWVVFTSDGYLVIVDCDIYDDRPSGMVWVSLVSQCRAGVSQLGCNNFSLKSLSDLRNTHSSFSTLAMHTLLIENSCTMSYLPALNAYFPFC